MCVMWGKRGKASVMCTHVHTPLVRLQVFTEVTVHTIVFQAIVPCCGMVDGIYETDCNTVPLPRRLKYEKKASDHISIRGNYLTSVTASLPS